MTVAKYLNLSEEDIKNFEEGMIDDIPVEKIINLMTLTYFDMMLNHPVFLLINNPYLENTMTEMIDKIRKTIIDKMTKQSRDLNLEPEDFSALVKGYASILINAYQSIRDWKTY